MNKRIVSIALAAAMTSALFLSGCGSDGGSTTATTAPPQTTTAGKTESSAAETAAQTEDTQAAAGISYPVEGSPTISWGLLRKSQWSDRYDSFTDLPLGKALQERTGYTIEAVHVDNNQAMNLMIASGDLPDIFTYQLMNQYNGKEAQAVKDGIIMGMTPEFLQENAPDYWAYLEANEDVKRALLTNDGEIVAFAFVREPGASRSVQTLMVRDDWCEELGMELPETADEFYAMLKGFKEQLGVEIPLALPIGHLQGALNNGFLTQPFGVLSRDKYQVDGKVIFGYMQPEYKDVLAWLNKLYEEGLMDPNFTTMDSDTLTAYMLSGDSGATAGPIGSMLGTYLTTNKDIEDYSLAPIKPLVANKGDRPKFGHMQNLNVGPNAYITMNCKDPAAAARFLNYGYTDEGKKLYNSGIEGVTYNIVDGQPVLTDLVTNNPDGLTTTQVLAEYTLSWDGGPFEAKESKYELPEQQEAFKMNGDTDAALYKMPETVIADEDSDEYARLASEINTYRDETEIKFIRGEMSLDQFDEYLATLDRMGGSRLLEIEQNALDVYNSK